MSFKYFTIKDFNIHSTKRQRVIVNSWSKKINGHSTNFKSYISLQSLKTFNF